MSNKNIKAWLNYNCSQGNNWVVLYKFDEICGHKNRKLFEVSGQHIVPSDKPLNLNLSHIYFTYMTENILITLIETTSGELYMIRNDVSIVEEQPPDEESSSDTVKKVTDVVSLPQVESIDSKVYHLHNVNCLRYCLSKSDRKRIGIVLNDWLLCKLKKPYRDELSHISYMDFINIESDELYVQKFDQFIRQSGDVLNLTNNYSIKTRLLLRTAKNTTVKELILNQNFQIDSFEWLQNFPNIKLINLLYCHQIEQKHIEQIVRLLPNLEVINIHFCSRINIRVLIPIFKLHKLCKIAINDPQFWCQKGRNELFILPEEWKNMDCPSLEKIAINSENLTLDVIDYILNSCGNVSQFITDENIMKLISNNVQGGTNKDQPLIFSAWQHPEKGFKIYKTVKFRNLIKNTDNQMFSDSMLKKIKEIKESRGEKEQTPIV